MISSILKNYLIIILGFELIEIIRTNQPNLLGFELIILINHPYFLGIELIIIRTTNYGEVRILDFQ
jgi:hypothetical protein